MPLIDHLRRMAWNNAWSNHRLLEACGRLSEDAYRAKRVSFFPSIHLTLNHILIVDWYYIDAIEGGGLGPRAYADEAPCATFAALEAAQRASDRRLIALVEGISEQELERVVNLDRGEAGLKPEAVASVLGHLYVHQIHHRGQVHAMLAGTEVPPPQLDEFFLDQDAHLRAGEMAALRARGYGGT